MTLLIAEAEPRPRLVGDGPAARPYCGRGLVNALLVLLVVVSLTGPAWGVNHDLPGDTAALLTWAARPFAAFVLLLRRPARVTALMSCSAATTLTIAAGFAAAATLSHTGIALSSFCALMIGYMAASAAGNVVPTPSGIGTADAALVGVLAASGSSLAHAVPIVIAFRLVTFWLPAVLGLGLARPLHRRGAL